MKLDSGSIGKLKVKLPKSSHKLNIQRRRPRSSRPREKDSGFSEKLYSPIFVKKSPMKKMVIINRKAPRTSKIVFKSLSQKGSKSRSYSSSLDNSGSLWMQKALITGWDSSIGRNSSENLHFDCVPSLTLRSSRRPKKIFSKKLSMSSSGVYKPQYLSDSKGNSNYTERTNKVNPEPNPSKGKKGGDEINDSIMKTARKMRLFYMNQGVLLPKKFKKKRKKIITVISSKPKSKPTPKSEIDRKKIFEEIISKRKVLIKKRKNAKK